MVRECHLMRDAIFPIMHGQQTLQHDIQNEGHPPFVKRSNIPSFHCAEQYRQELWFHSPSLL